MDVKCPRIVAFGWALGLGLALAALPARAGLSFEEGLARDPGDGRLLYREQHLVRREAGQPVARLVLYRCPDGTPFARKQVDYRGSPEAPAFRFEDARLGYGEGLRRRGDAGELWVRPGPGEAERSAPAELAGLVADAGFDEFIRRRWQPLLAGEAVPFEFAVPSRLERLDFRLRHLGSEAMDGGTAEVFRLRLGGWLGWLAPHIDVAYDRESRRLLRFEGLSNLREDDGQRQLVARIDFPEPARPADEARWQVWAGLALSGCRVRG